MINLLPGVLILYIVFKFVGWDKKWRGLGSKEAMWKYRYVLAVGCYLLFIDCVCRLVESDKYGEVSEGLRYLIMIVILVVVLDYIVIRKYVGPDAFAKRLENAYFLWSEDGKNYYIAYSIASAYFWNDEKKIKEAFFPPILSYDCRFEYEWFGKNECKEYKEYVTYSQENLQNGRKEKRQTVGCFPNGYLTEIIKQEAEDAKSWISYYIHLDFVKRNELSEYLTPKVLNSLREQSNLTNYVYVDHDAIKKWRVKRISFIVRVLKLYDFGYILSPVDGWTYMAENMWRRN